MASLRDIRNRIQSVKSTRQITNAMKMVAAAKLKRATDAATRARPYQVTLGQTLARVAAKAGDVEHPLLTPHPHVKRVALVVFGTDRGLCGGFNSTLGRRTDELLKSWRGEGKVVALRTFGKKPRDFLKSRNHEIREGTVDVKGSRYAEEAAGLADWLAAGFINGDFDEAYIGFNHFKSTLTQTPTFTRILPLAVDGSAAPAEGPSAEYVYEPDGASILGSLLPLYLRTLLLQAFLETEAGEHAARMTAMDNATRNAGDVIKALTLDYNRSRQAAITKELIEIISGAEAL